MDFQRICVRCGACVCTLPSHNVSQKEWKWKLHANWIKVWILNQRASLTSYELKKNRQNSENTKSFLLSSYIRNMKNKTEREEAWTKKGSEPLDSSTIATRANRGKKILFNYSIFIYKYYARWWRRHFSTAIEARLFRTDHSPWWWVWWHIALCFHFRIQFVCLRQIKRMTALVDGDAVFPGVNAIMTRVWFESSSQFRVAHTHFTSNGCQFVLVFRVSHVVIIRQQLLDFHFCHHPFSSLSRTAVAMPTLLGWISAKSFCSRAHSAAIILSLPPKSRHAFLHGKYHDRRLW